MRINFVMSNNVYSGIFHAIIKYFKQYLPENCELYVTEYPLKNMDIYHYHRPNLEKKLLPNSVVTVHHDLEDTDPWFDAEKFIEKYHQADIIVCLNSLQKKFLEIEEGLTNTVIIPHGIEKSLFIPVKRTVKLDKKFTVGIISKRYGRRVKGEAFLYELFKRLDNKKIKFVFVGAGRTKEKILANNFGFEADVYETLPYSMFNNLYSNLDFLLVPSLFEGGPANIPEAIYTKTPILGRKIAMISDMLIEGVNGYFLQGEPDIDAVLIDNLINNKNNIYRNLINNINEYTPNVLTWKEVVNKHIDIYKQILEGGV